MWVVWRVGADCVLHPLIHTFGLSESSTKCGSRFFRGKVWIKVCNLHSPNKKAGSLLTLPKSEAAIPLPSGSVHVMEF
jgi:hypothetical protein